MSGFESGPNRDPLSDLEREFDVMKALERSLAFQITPRPLPEGFESIATKRLPLGHAAFMGDFGISVED